MSGHLAETKLCSKLFFPNIKDKVSEFVNSCEACQHVKAGNKFDKGGEKLKVSACTLPNYEPAWH